MFCKSNKIKYIYLNQVIWFNSHTLDIQVWFDDINSLFYWFNSYEFLSFEGFFCLKVR